MSEDRNGLLKRLHPEGIPWPMSLVYSRLSASSIFQRHYQLVAEDVLAAAPQAREILDVGTGPGWLLLKLHEMCPATRLVGVDISAGMVAKARANIEEAGCGENVEILEAGAAELRFPDESFDLVVSTGSLHHWKQPVAGLNEIHRVLRPGGRALVYDLVKRMPAEVKRAAAARFGRLRMKLLWLHSFEEPFREIEDMERLATETLFGSGTTRFVGVLCCLDLRK